MTQTEMLLASLTTISEHESYHPGGDNEFDGRSFDWSTRDGEHIAFDVCNSDGESVGVWITENELRELHARLTVHLLSKEH